jgi:hypothetical protein
MSSETQKGYISNQIKSNQFIATQKHNSNTYNNIKRIGGNQGSKRETQKGC